jgi:hypothetical protein
MTTTETEKPRFKPGDKAPAAAFQFAAVSPVKFASDDQPQSKSKPFEMVVRSRGPVAHWYFGSIVHDFAGMKSKPVVAVDWNHDPDELVGKAGEFDTSGDLIARGTVESIEVGDQADKIIKLSAVGVPFEASIYFDPYELVLENVPEGFVAEVNGETVEGPVVIAREWTLRRIAICPSGVDGASEVRFSTSATESAFSLNLKDCPTMTKANNPGTPAAADPTPATPTTPATATEMSADDHRTKFQTELKRYTDKFGAADGATYFSSGCSYEQALEKHVEKLAESAKTAEAAKMTAEQKLAAINLGETRPVDSGGTPGGDTKTTFSSCFKAATEKANATGK